MKKWLGFLFLNVGVLWAQALTDFIVVDQFGYRPEAEKTAVIRSPQEGGDAAPDFSPGMLYQVIDEATGNPVFEGAPALFNEGETDSISGDKIWWFDFSPVTAPGRYYVLDSAKNIRSFSFSIANDVYNETLKHAMRVFFYQRAGVEKTAAFAGADWADGASHIKQRQDIHATIYSDSLNTATARDLSGAWYDAGDYNKYTAWTANYVEQMLSMYLERPQAFTDDYGIPESGNGVPDLIDETKWGMDWILKMQNPDGSVLSVVGLASGSPPSSVSGASYYGPANTTATLSAVKAFALGAIVFRYLGNTAYADTLTVAAVHAWNWAAANPDSVFHNNCGEAWNKSNCPNYDSRGLAAGDQELTDDWDKVALRMSAALYMFEITGDASYVTIFENGFAELPFTLWGGSFMDQYRHDQHLMMLRYLENPRITSTFKESLKPKMNTGFKRAGDFAGAIGTDGYRSFIKAYNWGSNKYKSDYGVIFYLWAEHNLDPSQNETYFKTAEEYLHYIHGVNPFNMVYLSNMNNLGASKSLTEIYHSWFDHYSAKWDKVTDSTTGPAPGFLAGGPNASFKWDACCDGQTCGGAANNAMCFSEELPKDLPAAKMYKDFNTSWPLNSWEITEPSMGYQLSYVRLISKFVEERGEPLRIPKKQQKPNAPAAWSFSMTQNHRQLNLSSSRNMERVEIFDVRHRKVLSQTANSTQVSLNVSGVAPGVYFVKVLSGNRYEIRSLLLR
ncbi:MAG: glycoside hydrolase family 9 protein [Fibrobacter sp.]|jgi:hypothetical protein|nr:glycoside hydrolase family 9 protein [Fibrobacter sp.]